MRRTLLVLSVVLTVAGYLRGDANLKILDVGLHGYIGSPAAVRLFVQNPSAAKELLHLKVTVGEEWGGGTVAGDVSLEPGEHRIVELPTFLAGGQPKIIAEATAAGSLVGRDSNNQALRWRNVIVLMCGNDEACKTAQTNIQFSGSVENRADKNRQLAYEVVNDAREDWWAYSCANAVVLAGPLNQLQATQLDALEGYLRRGGRLVLVEQLIADPNFLSAYREGAPAVHGEPVGKGLLFRVPNLAALGDAFAGENLPRVLTRQDDAWWMVGTRKGFLESRYATAFNFPRLRWLLIWLAAYIVVIGVLNFVVLQRLRMLEFGWISTLVLALLFAAAMYYSSASRRPNEFHLDNLATYYLDAKSASAAADYSVRLSTPERRNIVISVDDAAIFIGLNASYRHESSSQIWGDISRNAVRAMQFDDVSFGPPRQLAFPLLKWSFRDLDLAGLHPFPGTVHFVAPNRLRNDTGQKLKEATYVDYDANALYALPDLAPGDEVDLAAMTSKRVHVPGKQFVVTPPYQAKPTLDQLATMGAWPFSNRGRIFVGLSDGPALPVSVNVRNVEQVHSLIVVNMGQE